MGLSSNYFCTLRFTSWNSVICRRTFPASLLAEVSGYLSTVYIRRPTHEHIALINNQGGL